ncbi:Solute carrier family 32 [Gigaspora margarita]|uniref:Solute carrier family 32 n=1 Tax=Gigaspora margarita TaxID=4874 RepID=A0A8H4B3P3_GIGMA|nr:Solute carrier family 32 [Gigaspora margarita]
MLDQLDLSEILKDKPSSIKSSYGQTLWNFCNVLIGVGSLSLPFAFKFSGWIIGLSLLFFCMGVTNYTTRLLIKCLNYKEGLYTYPDIAMVAYGKFVKFVVLALFTLELIGIAIAFITLIGDSLYVLFPKVSLVLLKIISWAVLVPLTLIDIKYLSYVSFLGLVSTIFLTIVIIIDGVTTHEQPGSLLNPMKTELFPTKLNSLPLCFGFMIAGFAGYYL